MKNRKISKTILALLAATLCFAGQQAQATPISGHITLAGGVVFQPNNLATATRVTEFDDVSVISADGSFTGVSGAVAMTAPWVFSPVPGSPVNALWSVGGFTFDLAATTAVERPIVGGIQFLVITGTGTIFGPGDFTATPGDWSFSTQNPKANGEFSFSAAAEAHGVPEGGSALTLLGLGMFGLAALRAKLVKL